MKTGLSIKRLATYEWPVDVRVPCVDANGNGSFEVHRFTGVFKHLSYAEGQALLERLSAQAKDQAQRVQDGADVADGAMSALRVGGVVVQTQIDTYMELWVGWGEDLTDEDGTPLPYSEETKRLLLGQRSIREAVIEAHRLSQGGEPVREKNLSLSPEAGQATGESATGNNAQS